MIWLCCALCSDKPNWGSQTTQGSSPTKMAPPGAIAFSWWPHNSNFTMVYDTQITIVMGFWLPNKHNWGVRHCSTNEMLGDFSLWGVVRRGTFRWKLGSEWWRSQPYGSTPECLEWLLRAHWLLALTSNFCWLVQSVQSQMFVSIPMLYEDSLYAVTCNVFTLRGFDDPKRRIKTIQNRTEVPRFLGSTSTVPSLRFLLQKTSKNHTWNPSRGFPVAGGWGGWRCRDPLCWPKCVHGTCLGGGILEIKKGGWKVGGCDQGLVPPSYVCWLTKKTWILLVGGLEHVLFIHILGIIIPTDELIFFRGVGWNHQLDSCIPKTIVKFEWLAAPNWTLSPRVPNPCSGSSYWK